MNPSPSSSATITAPFSISMTPEAIDTLIRDIENENYGTAIRKINLVRDRDDLPTELWVAESTIVHAIDSPDHNPENLQDAILGLLRDTRTKMEGEKG